MSGSEILTVPVAALEAWRPELALVATILLGLLVGSIRRGLSVKLTTLAGLLATTVLAGFDVSEAIRYPLGAHFVVDGPASVVRLAILLATSLTVFSLTRRQDHRGSVMLAVAALGLVLMAEAVTVSGLLLASAIYICMASLAVSLHAPRRVHAAVRQWLLTAGIGFLMLAFGTILWSALTGTLVLAGLVHWSAPPPMTLPLIFGLWGVSLVLVLLTEPGRFGSGDGMMERRDHDDCHGPPPVLTGWVTAVPPLVLVVVLHRLLGGAAREHLGEVLPHLATWSAAVLIVGGFLAALTRRTLQRRLAWAATGQVGLALMGFSVTADPDAVLPLLLVFAAAQLGALALVGVIDGLGSIPNRHRRHFLPLLMAFLLLSLTALPPLAGWRPRLGLLQALLAGDRFAGAGLVLLGTLAGCFVYLRPLVDLWRHEDRAEEPPAGRPIWAIPSLLSAAALVALLLAWSVGLLKLA